MAGGGAGEGKFVGPEFFAGVGVEGAEFFVGGAGDEDEPTGGHARAAEIVRAGRRHAGGGQGGDLAERDAPEGFAGVEVVAVEKTPRRLDAGVAFVIVEKTEAVENELGIVAGTGAAAALARGRLVAAEEEIDDGLLLGGIGDEIGRHDAAAFGEDFEDGVVLHPGFEAEQGRDHAETLPRGAVAGGAAGGVNVFAGGRRELGVARTFVVGDDGDFGNDAIGGDVEAAWWGHRRPHPTIRRRRGNRCRGEDALRRRVGRSRRRLGRFVFGRSLGLRGSGR